MRDSLARQVKFSIVQYNSVSQYIQMRASLARQVKFSIFQYNSVFYIYSNAGFTGSTG